MSRGVKAIDMHCIYTENCVLWFEGRVSFSIVEFERKTIIFFLYFFPFLLSLVQSSLRIGNHQCNIHFNKLTEIFKIIHTKRHSHLSRDTKYRSRGSNVSYSKIVQWKPFRLGESTLIDLYICLHHYVCVYIASSFLFYLNLWIVYEFCETVLFLVRFLMQIPKGFIFASTK